MMRQNLPSRLVLSSVYIGLFFSLNREKKSQKEVLIKNETEIHQIF